MCHWHACISALAYVIKIRALTPFIFIVNVMKKEKSEIANIIPKKIKARLDLNELIFLSTAWLLVNKFGDITSIVFIDGVHVTL